jgi:hypothetical protein
MNRQFNRFIFALLASICLTLLTSLPEAHAQCPMCKSNVSAARNANQPVGNGLNTGILYLLAAPYVLVGGLGYYWYRTMRKNNAA